MVHNICYVMSQITLSAENYLALLRLKNKMISEKKHFHTFNEVITELLRTAPERTETTQKQALNEVSA